MLSQVRRLLLGSKELPDGLAIAPDEEVRREGVAAITRGQFGGRWGPLILTSRRLIWYESGPIWPLKRQTREIHLEDIEQVDEGTVVDKVLLAKRIQIRLRNGKTIRFFEGQGGLASWVAELRAAVSDTAV